MVTMIITTKPTIIPIATGNKLPDSSNYLSFLSLPSSNYFLILININLLIFNYYYYF